MRENNVIKENSMNSTTAGQHWQAGRFRLSLAQTWVMGIVNLTPDSFSDGGQYASSLSQSLTHAQNLLADGAAILDVGGESTRPGAAAVSADEEWRRLEPFLREVVGWHVPISVDTRRTATMRRALDMGVDIINDVQALEDDGAVALLAEYADVGVCLMHMKGQPETMQNQAVYADVCADVAAYLRERTAVCEAAGIARKRLMLDPGFGFAKTLEHNVALMRDVGHLGQALHLPVLVGVSRKRFIGTLTGRDDAQQRVAGSVAAALFAAKQGAAVLRVHDVRETVDALKVWQALDKTMGA